MCVSVYVYVHMHACLRAYMCVFYSHVLQRTIPGLFVHILSHYHHVHMCQGYV